MNANHQTDASSNRNSNGGKVLARSSLFLASLSAALLSVETGMRIKTWIENQDTLESIEAEAPLPPGTVVTLKHFVRPVPNDDLIYEMKPNVDGLVFEGASVRTNRFGFRGPEIELEKAPGTIRILGIGDSVMFGQAVEESENYLTVLNQRLNSAYPQRNWEIINTAVPGYNTVMEVETLISKGLAFDPDLVILGVVGNDLDLPNFLYEQVDPLDFERSFLIDFVTSRFDTSSKLATSGLVDAPLRDGDLTVFENDPATVPARYSHMVGMDSAMRAAAKLAELRDVHGFEVMSCAYWEDPSLAQKPPFAFMASQRLMELGLFPIDQGPEFADFLTRHEILDYDKAQFVVSATDPHPSGVHHRLIAETFFKSMVESGLIEKLLQ